jgi:hypothetical protein
MRCVRVLSAWASKTLHGRRCRAWDDCLLLFLTLRLGHV